MRNAALACFLILIPCSLRALGPDDVVRTWQPCPRPINGGAPDGPDSARLRVLSCAGRAEQQEACRGAGTPAKCVPSDGTTGLRDAGRVGALATMYDS